MKGKWIELKAWLRGLKHAPSWRQRRWHLREILRILFTRLPLPNEAGQAVSTLILVVSLVTVVAGGTYLVVERARSNNLGHAESQHGDTALTARAAMLANIEDSNPKMRLYYSPRRGTVLGIVNLGTEGTGDTPMCAGVVWRVTENMGARWLGDEAYECTAYVTTCSYWNRVIRRDRYAPIAQYPSIEYTFIDWFRAVIAPQYP